MRGLVVAGQRRVDARRTPGGRCSKPGLEVLQVVETAREQAGAGDQQHRQRHLRHHQALAQPRVRRAAGQRAGFLAQRLVDVGARGLQRRRQAEDEGGERPRPEREQPDAEVGRGGQRPREARRRAAARPAARQARSRAPGPRCRPPATAAGSRTASGASMRRGWRRAPAARPSPSAARPPARAAGWRRWRRRSAARGRPCPSAPRAASRTPPRMSDRAAAGGVQHQRLGAEALLEGVLAAANCRHRLQLVRR